MRDHSSCGTRRSWILNSRLRDAAGSNTMKPPSSIHLDAAMYHNPRELMRNDDGEGAPNSASFYWRLRGRGK